MEMQPILASQWLEQTQAIHGALVHLESLHKFGSSEHTAAFNEVFNTDMLPKVL